MEISTLSSLPTDSLYKFMALSGIVIFVISVVLPEFAKKKFKFQLFELRKSLEIHRIRSEQSSTLFHCLQKKLKKKRKNIKI
jgi:hypothetical protein